MTSVDQFHIE